MNPHISIDKTDEAAHEHTLLYTLTVHLHLIPKSLLLAPLLLHAGVAHLRLRGALHFTLPCLLRGGVPLACYDGGKHSSFCASFAVEGEAYAGGIWREGGDWMQNEGGCVGS